MKIINADVYINLNCLLGEGCIYNYNNQLLYWIDIEGRSLYYYSFSQNSYQKRELKSRPGTVIPYQQDTVIIAIEDGIYLYNFLEDTYIESLIETPFLKMESLRFNDGKCDANGNLWIGTMHLQAKKDAGELYLFNNNLISKVKPTTISNGIAWSSDNKTMYYIDTVLSNILAFDYDIATLEISNKRIIVQIDPEQGYPDGMTIDSEGMLWVALWDGYGVGRFNPITGELIAKVNVPAPKITSCAFGGENLDILFITSARVDMSEEELEKYPLSGSLFSANVGISGIKSNHFKLL